MLGFNGGTIGIANTVFTGTKSDDPNYSSVSLLLHGDGTNGSTTFIDSSSNSHTVTPFANAQISTTQSKFGGASMYFDGSGDYIDCGTDSSYDMGSGDFTIEGWFYYLGTNNLYPCIITNNPGSWTTGAVIFHIDHTSLQDKISFWAFDHSSSSPIVANTTSIIYNQWHHFAIVRSGTVVRLAYNGQIEATATISASLEFKFNLPSIRIGGGNWSGFNGDFNGYIDDLRITKGVARYTDNFTPPTAQLPGGETGTFASGLWTSSDHIKQIRNELWPGVNFYTYTLGGLSGKFFNGTWRSTISTGNIGTLPLTTTNESSNVTGSGGMPSADHRYGINLWDYITYTTIGDSYGFIAIGYFKPPTTGTYTFYTSSDDYSGVWIGSDALPGATRTTSNAVVNNGMGGSSGQANTKRSGTISLTANTYYPIRIVHEEGSGGDNLTFSWSGPSISETTDLTQYFYSISLGGTLTGNYYGL
jgi:hypothetical protein